MQRVSVSCGARRLSNVRDEAVGEGGVSSDSHSSRRAIERVRCRRAGVRRVEEPSEQSRGAWSGSGVNVRLELLAGCSEPLNGTG